MNLLYSTKNSTQYSVMTYMEKEFKEGGIYIYIYICITDLGFPGGSVVKKSKSESCSVVSDSLRPQ